MSLVVDTVTAHLPSKRKHTPSGWISFNAICCHNMGHKADTRHRGGIMINEGVSYHCFNCGFKSSWQPGRTISTKFRKLLRWLNVSDDLIGKCSLEALRLKENSEYQFKQNPLPNFIDKNLPLNSKSIKNWLDEDIPDELLNVIQYLCDRGIDPIKNNLYYTNEVGFKNRIIIPFYYKEKLVGWTARAINQAKPKYLSEQQPGYVFNLDNQTDNRKYVIVCEGPFDAISIDGVAILGSEISTQQANLINQLNREVIVLADRDQAGQKIIHQAVNYGWSVSFPEWPDSIKDANDAVIHQGQLSTLYSIITAKTNNSLKIQLNAKKWID